MTILSINISENDIMKELAVKDLKAIASVMLVFRFSPKSSCDHRWGFSELAGSMVCDAGIDSCCYAKLKDTSIKCYPPKAA